jgi:hypothetical protein
MVKITVEVPESLVGDIYLAVGEALQRGQDELDEATADREEGRDDESTDEA